MARFALRAGFSIACSGRSVGRALITHCGYWRARECRPRTSTMRYAGNVRVFVNGSRGSVSRAAERVRRAGRTVLARTGAEARPRARDGGAVSGGGPPGRERSWRAGVVEDGSCATAATCGTARRDEHHSVGTSCGEVHTGRSAGVPDGHRNVPPAPRGARRGGPDHPVERYLLPQTGSEWGVFHDLPKVPARCRGRLPDRPSCVHSVLRTLRGVIFVNLWWAKRHFTLPYGATTR